MLPHYSRNISILISTASLASLLVASNAEADTNLCINKFTGATRVASGSCFKFETKVTVPSGTMPSFEYKIGDTGPGGGIIFFVDKDDQYPGFTYLEVAPADASPTRWCDYYDAISPLQAWTANAVGQGQANTTAMLGSCTEGAAVEADNYVSPNGTEDWFLPSEGELMLMYANLRQSGKGAFNVNTGGQNYWSSTQGVDDAWVQSFFSGLQQVSSEGTSNRVRPIRAF